MKEGVTIAKQELVLSQDDWSLIKEYAYKLYGDNAETYLQTEQAKPQWIMAKDSLCYQMGSISLEFFCKFYLQNIFRQSDDNNVRELAPFHYEMWQTLQSMFLNNKMDKLEMLMPRGSSKTTTCDVALTIWLHCYPQETFTKYTLILGKTQTDAEQFVSTIVDQFRENRYIKKTFGNLVSTAKNDGYKVKSDEIVLLNDTKIQALSSASSVRGKNFNGIRPSCVIADDYQSDDEVLTQESRDKKYIKWIDQVENVGDKAVYTSHARQRKLKKPATKFIVLGTLLHRDCFMSRLKNLPTYVHIEKKAILLDNIDTYFDTGIWKQFKSIYFDPKRQNRLQDAQSFYESHYDEMQYPVLWADKYDCFDLAISYYNNPTSFKKEYQNDVTHIGEKYFHDIHTFTDEELADHKQNGNIKYTILCCDPAVGTANHNDYSAFVVASKDNNNFRWMQKGIIAKLTYDAYLNQIISLLKAYPEIKMLWVEKNVFSGADVRDLKIRINADEDLKKRNLEIINEHQNKNKENKIQAITGKVDSGYILFNENDTEFIEQIKQFAGVKYSAHDDAPDIVSEADRLLTVTKQTPEIKLYKIWK